MEDEKPKFYCTFGQAHENAGCYIVIRATCPAQAQRIMTARFGNQWSHMYLNAGDAGVEKWNLKEIK